MNANREKISDRKGTNFRWTGDSASWYEEASEYTGYHDRLTEILAPWLNTSMSCCELACGTGSLARHLAPLVKSYTANDLDPHAVGWLKDKLSEAPQENLSIIAGDWRKALAGTHFDTAIFSYFGAVLEDMDTLRKIADTAIIVTPRTAGQRKMAMVAAMNGRSFETYPALIEFLKAEGIPHDAFEIDLEFGQSFHNLKTAREYVEYYYKLKGDDIDIFLSEKLRKTDFGWYFPKLKDLGIIRADISGKREKHEL